MKESAVSQEKLLDLKQLEEQLSEYASEREWEKYHTPKNLSMALTVEAGELMEIFQWLTEEESYRVKDKGHPKKEAVADEVADVLTYLVRLSSVLDINIIDALQNKMKKNALKYPIEKAKGNALKYDEY